MSEHTPQPYDDLNTPKLILAAILGIAVTIAVVAWLQAMYYVQASAEEKRQLEVTPRQVVETKAKWSATLSSYGKANTEKGIAQVPIERAMKAVAEELHAR
ncbi:MAG: hypothetical protein IPN34_24155 [Planctomycetes bacterium]|nr:hypothetical protein [Planctomycetota bacterium]